jgi:hypothetical protein
MPNNYERFATAYLRLNGYFTVPNFIVLAADDSTRISNGIVGNYTEADIIGIRLPHSREVTGGLDIRNHDLLVDGASGMTDVVVAEAKSGNEDRPNKVWLGPHAEHVARYIARFVGLHEESALQSVGHSLGTAFRFTDERSRFRYVLFAESPNTYYAGRGVSYITYEQAIHFIVEVRGPCWIESQIGVVSAHHQWDDLLVAIFKVANRTNESVDTRVQEIKSMLSNREDR